MDAIAHVKLKLSPHALMLRMANRLAKSVAIKEFRLGKPAMMETKLTGMAVRTHACSVQTGIVMPQ